MLEHRSRRRHKHERIIRRLVHGERPADLIAFEQWQAYDDRNLARLSEAGRTLRPQTDWRLALIVGGLIAGPPIALALIYFLGL